MAKPQQPGLADTVPLEVEPVGAHDIIAQLAAYDSVELPPELKEWLAEFVGCLETSFSFDPDTYFGQGWGPYGAVD